ncbi:organic cation transporter protein-like isoform X2 [Oratosquilla oratoria]
MVERFDDLLVRIGTGRWNLYYFFCMGFWYMILPMHILAGSFFSPNLDFECEETSPDPLPDDVTSPECNLYNATANTIVPCTSWTYNNTVFHTTVTSDFDLVCDRAYLRATFQSIYMFGNFFGAFFNGIASDKYGRRKLLFVGTATFMVSSIVATWLPTFSTVFAARFLAGTAHPVLLQSGFCLAMEVCEPRFRAAVGILICLPWAFGTMIWGGLGYLIRDWRWLQLTIALPSLTFIPSLWFMDESPRWLLVKKKKEELLKILQKGAKWNQVPAPTMEEVERIIEAETKLTEKEKTLNTSQAPRKRFLNFVLFRTPRTRRITLVLFVNFCLVSMVYYGLSLSGGSYTNDPFLYMVFTGLMEVPGYSATIPLLNRIGRKIPIISGFLICGLALLTIIVIPEDLGLMAVTLAMLGKLAITGVFQALYVYSIELYPTEIRITGLGFSIMSSRFGSIISPYIIQYLVPVFPWLPSFIFGVSSIIAGLLLLALHDTRDMALLDTVAELEAADIKKTRYFGIKSEKKKFQYTKANTEAEVISNPDGEIGLKGDPSS